MDFLILMIALVVPNLPDPMIRSVQMGELAVKIIVLFFSFEVLLGEMRKREPADARSAGGAGGAGHCLEVILRICCAFQISVRLG